MNTYSQTDKRLHLLCQLIAKANRSYVPKKEDEMVGAPYFYLSAYALKGDIAYDHLAIAEGWEWIVKENWKGAILLLEQLKAKSYPEQEGLVKRYLTEALHWYISK